MQQRTGFIGIDAGHVSVEPGLMNDAERGANGDSRQSSGIAMRQDRCRLTEQRSAKKGNFFIHGPVVASDGFRLCFQPTEKFRVRTLFPRFLADVHQAAERPGQVHRRGTGCI